MVEKKWIDTIISPIMETSSQTIEERLAEIEKKVDATFRSSEKMRRYFFWTLVITLVVVVVPLLIMPFVIPSFLASVTIPEGF